MTEFEQWKKKLKDLQGHELIFQTLAYILAMVESIERAEFHLQGTRNIYSQALIKELERRSGLGTEE